MKSCKAVLLVLISMLSIAAACTAPNFIQTQYDIATDTKNFRWDHRSVGFTWPLVSLNQSFVKQLDGNQPHYRLYDIVILRADHFKLDDKVFMVLDDNPIRMQLQKREDDVRLVRDDPSDVLVNIGNSEEYYQVTRFEYVFSPEVVEQMTMAKSIQFTYYSGPEIITINFSEEKVIQLQKLLLSN